MNGELFLKSLGSQYNYYKAVSDRFSAGPGSDGLVSNMKNIYHFIRLCHRPWRNFLVFCFQFVFFLNQKVNIFAHVFENSREFSHGWIQVLDSTRNTISSFLGVGSVSNRCLQAVAKMVTRSPRGTSLANCFKCVIFQS